MYFTHTHTHQPSLLSELIMRMCESQAGNEIVTAGEELCSWTGRTLFLSRTRREGQRDSYTQVMYTYYLLSFSRPLQLYSQSSQGFVSNWNRVLRCACKRYSDHISHVHSLFMSKSFILVREAVGGRVSQEHQAWLHQSITGYQARTLLHTQGYFSIARSPTSTFLGPTQTAQGQTRDHGAVRWQHYPVYH